MIRVDDVINDRGKASKSIMRRVACSEAKSIERMRDGGSLKDDGRSLSRGSLCIARK